MDCVANQVCSGTLPYVNTRDLEDCLRNKITAKIGLRFFKDCFEAVTADKSGLFVLSGGAAAACHIDEKRDMLKCLDFDYYNCSKEWLQLAQMQKHLQACVDVAFDNLTQLTANIRMQSPLTILKCFQNGAYCFGNDDVNLRLLPHIDTVRTNFNNEFDLIRFALQVEMWTQNGVDEYNNQKLMINKRHAVIFNVFFVNVRVMKHPFFGERCSKKFIMFGDNYHVLVSPLHRVLNDQIMCLLKDIFTDKLEFKVERRKTLIRALFAKLPQDACDVCVNNHSDVAVGKHRFENITSFCKKTLDIYGPALGCRKLVYAYLTTNTFLNQIPHYVADYANYPHNRQSCEQKWREFMGVMYLL
ncbi:hypothetical protein [Epiphyas postvittana nucleopolyhedrovirus]|uniref:Uncharacterized protein n=1 Tax=Epiphyas postvittana nucleopolyhedrovirus TaxID=70600 RepID=Q91GN4_NPVEP|nr:hypothetical protein [Epiphyas postvittana nucleopolyhedrovirus]AAK85579.1 unknown [Epiphyas postvittana nucleopolyhedrovirus]